MAKVYATPGVYIEEKSAFPNSAVAVPTAVPAFVGYTARAMRGKKPLLNVPTRISSYGEFIKLFGLKPKTTYKIEANPDTDYTLTVDKKSQYYLYSCMRMFFANGGSDCYIVSVGNFDPATGVESGKLLDGITPLLKEPEPTMLVIPDAVALEEETEYMKVIQAMLKHCGFEMRNRFAIIDVYNGTVERNYDKESDVIMKFREDVGNEHLQWGAAYYPWVQTSIIQASELSYLNISNVADLAGILDADVDKSLADGEIDQARADEIKAESAKLAATTDPDPVLQLSNTLLAVSPMFKSIMGDLRTAMNLLPPSAGMAGIYSMVDNSIGVHQSPANVTFGSVIKPAVNITSKDQEDLNLPLNGKAVNAIRTFPGKGVLVWGARTLDGNSMDWRYISVRRTVIMIEQSIKIAAEAYVFEPNVSSTWINLKALITNFLTNVWQAGALAGATTDDAFNVDVGLGTTMTPIDILDGYMRISVKIAVTRPAEFIVITFQQKMQQS